MPTPILRAGPFASSSDSFLNEPSTPIITILPVNCATNDWVNDTWKAYTRRQGFSGGVTIHDDEDYDGTLPDTISFDLSSVGNQLGVIHFRFRYQSAVDFDININAEANADAGTFTSGALVQIQASANGVIVIDEEDSGSAVVSLSYDNDITLPASVTPAFCNIFVYAQTSVTGPVTSSADASLEISVPT